MSGGNFHFAVLGFIAGAVGAMIAMPAPLHPDHCTVQKVDTRTAISYALRAPPAPAPVEHVVVKEVCPQVTKLPEIESKPEATNTDERPRRRHRRHRRWR
jgi:hypothetical protein